MSIRLDGGSSQLPNIEHVYVNKKDAQQAEATEKPSWEINETSVKVVATGIWAKILSKFDIPLFSKIPRYVELTAKDAQGKPRVVVVKYNEYHEALVNRGSINQWRESNAARLDREKIATAAYEAAYEEHLKKSQLQKTHDVTGTVFNDMQTKADDAKRIKEHG